MPDNLDYITIPLCRYDYLVRTEEKYDILVRALQEKEYIHTPPVLHMMDEDVILREDEQ